MPDEALVEAPSLEVLAERVRERLIAHGQHGALAEFATYTAAVTARIGLPAFEATIENGIAYHPPADSESTDAAIKATRKTKAAK